MSKQTIDTMKANHDAAVDAGTGSDGLAALSRAREEMYFRNKDAELIKALNAKTKKPRAKR